MEGLVHLEDDSPRTGEVEVCCTCRQVVSLAEAQLRVADLVGEGKMLDSHVGLDLAQVEEDEKVVGHQDLEQAVFLMVEVLVQVEDQ